jgi:hypothetical protein
MCRRFLRTLHRASRVTAVILLLNGCTFEAKSPSPLQEPVASTHNDSASASFEECSQKTIPGKLCNADLSQLRPTQFCVGFRDIARKKAKIELEKKSSSGTLATKSLKHGTAIKGPEDVFYLVDGHHRAKALQEAGENLFTVKIIADYSDLPMTEFWDKLVREKMVWLYDERGGGPQSPLHLPTSLVDLVDDPYRTLAEDAQDRGANKKLDVLFQEFYWANFYRTRIEKTKVLENYEGALEEAVNLANTPAASELPGFIGATN